MLFNALYLSWYNRFNYCNKMARRVDIPLWKKKVRCWDNFIRVYPVALSKGPRAEVRLEIEIKGQFKQGELIFKQTKKGKYELAKKIDEVYEWLYENHKKKFNQPYGANYKRKHFSLQ